MFYPGEFSILYLSYSHYRLDLLNIVHNNTIVHDLLIGSDAVSTPLIDGTTLKDPSPHTNPSVLNTGSQIINQLEITSGTMPTLPSL